MLIHFGVKPYIVFDGDYLPSKAHTEKERSARRKESRRIGLELLRVGKTSEAHLELQKAVDVTPEMARQLIEELRKAGVDYVVAPYEADSQLAYLEQKGIISGILSEDSDLLVFGAKCLLTKLDQYGDCIMINRAEFTACREISLVGWTDKEFRIMSMLNGCDYLPGIDKMGLKTAYRLVRKHKTIDRIVRTVQFDGKMKVPAGYLEAFQNAEWTFLYQWVFCPEAQRLVNLTPPPADVDVGKMLFIGKYVEAQIAVEIATGNLNPNTKQPIKFHRPERYTLSRSTVETPDLKKGKTISEFFKTKRTPLQELDPNSFTPSPSQQRLLNAQPTPWSATQVAPARPILNRASTAVTSSAPQPSRRSLTDPCSTTASMSSKRQRLCSDSTTSVVMNAPSGLDAATSRFFAKSKTTATSSPSLRKSSALKKKDEFSLWSDDSLEEAMASLPEPVTAPGSQCNAAELPDVDSMPTSTKTRKLRIFSDDPAPMGGCQTSSTNTSRTTSQDTVTTAATSVESQELTATETTITPVKAQNSKPPVESSIFSKGIEADFSTLKSKYMYSSTPARTSPRKSTLRTKSAPLAAKSLLQTDQRNQLLGGLANASRLPANDTVKSGTLELDHRNANDEQISPNVEDCVPGSSPLTTATAARAQTWDLSPLPNISAPDAAEVDNTVTQTEAEINDDEWLAMEEQPLSPEPRRTDTEAATAENATVVKGSEDLLVPNSPESDVEVGGSRPVLDLGRFTFTA